MLNMIQERVGKIVTRWLGMLGIEPSGPLIPIEDRAMENRQQLRNLQESIDLLENTMAEFDREIAAIQQMLNHTTQILIDHGKSPDEARAIAETAALHTPPTDKAKRARSPGKGRGGQRGRTPLKG
jgi:hypothetical protein